MAHQTIRPAVRRTILAGQKLSIRDQYSLFYVDDSENLISAYIEHHQLDEVMQCMLFRRFGDIFWKYARLYRCQPRVERLIFDSPRAAEFVPRYVALHPLTDQMQARLFELPNATNTVMRYIERYADLSFAAQLRMARHPDVAVLAQKCRQKHCLMPSIAQQISQDR